MIDSNKQYPPSETKLARLRANGIIAFSKDFQSCAVIIGFVVCCLCFMKSEVAKLLTVIYEYTIPFVDDSLVDDSVLEHFKSLFNIASISMLKLLFVILGFYCLLGLYQTRFLLTSKGLGVSFERLSFKSPILSLRQFLVNCSCVLKVFAFLIVCVVVSIYGMERALPHLSLDAVLDAYYGDVPASDDANDKVGQLFKRIEDCAKFMEIVISNVLIVTAVFCVIIGVISRACVVWMYLRENSMTLSEVEAEMRETEIRPEMKQAHYAAGLTE